jgi:hypothetical protein
MADLQACMRDGYSTAGSAGEGLGAVSRWPTISTSTRSRRRHADPGASTASATRLASRAAPQRLCGGAVCLAAPGEHVSGDGWDVALHDHRADVVVADGLGHGPDAAEAADGALAVFDRSMARPGLVERPCAARARAGPRWRHGSTASTGASGLPARATSWAA